MFYCSEIFLLTIHYLIASNSVCRQDAVHPPAFGVSCLWHDSSLFQNLHSDELANYATIHSVGFLNRSA